MDWDQNSHLCRFVLEKNITQKWTYKTGLDQLVNDVVHTK